MEEEKQKGGYQSKTDTFSRFTITISRSLSDELEARAEKEKRTKSYFIEEALSQYFSSPVSPDRKEGISHQEESSGLQDTLRQIQDEISTIKSQAVSASMLQEMKDSILQQVSDKVESRQMQIDALKTQAASSPGVISRPPAAKKNQTASTSISSIEEIQSDAGYPVNEAAAILEKLSRNPMSVDALRMRCKRGVKSENLKPEDIGYKDAEGYHIKGSYLVYYLKSDASQIPL